MQSSVGAGADNDLRSSQLILQMLQTFFMFRLRVSSSADLRIDLSAQQNDETRYVQPQQEDDDRTQRAVCLAVGVKEVQIQFETE